MIVRSQIGCASELSTELYNKKTVYQPPPQDGYIRNSVGVDSKNLKNPRVLASFGVTDRAMMEVFGVNDFK